MAVFLSPVGGVAAQFFTNTGAVLTGGKLYTYAAGTTTPLASYTTSAGSTAWTNPIILDSAGRISGGGEVWLTQNVVYKFLLKDSSDVLIGTYDNVSGISDVTLPLSSNNVTYTPAGTGAVATTVQAKLRQTVSVKDFGAVGDGTTDDTAAIQAAITYAVATIGNNIYFPKGTYKVTATLTIPTVNNSKSILYGSGAVIQATHNGVLFQNNNIFVAFKDLTLAGPGRANTNSVGIVGSYFDGYLNNVTVNSFYTGVKTQSITGKMDRCFFGDCHFCVWLQDFTNIFVFDSCYFSSSDYGVYVPNTSSGSPGYVAQVTVFNCAFEVCGTSFYSVGINRLLIENSWFEQEVTGSLVLTDTPVYIVNTNFVNFQPSVSYTSGFPTISKQYTNMDSYLGFTNNQYNTVSTTSITLNGKAYPNSGMSAIEWNGFLAGNGYKSRILGGNNNITIDAPNFVPLADNTTTVGTTSLRWSDTYSNRFHPGDATVLWTSGSGSPQGAVTAVVGSLFTRTDGGANTTLYIKESGTGNTGWVAK